MAPPPEKRGARRMFRKATLLAALAAVMIVGAAGLAWAKTDTGNNGDNHIVGTDGQDQLYGAGGDDTIRGLEDDDLEYGGAGEDRLWGGLGDDGIEDEDIADDAGLYGQNGPDTLYGGNGDDYLVGGLGADVLRGGDHNDTLDARDGIPSNDFIICGTGNDTVSFDSRDEVDPVSCQGEF